MSPQSTESSIVLHSSSEDVDAVDFDLKETELTLGLGLGLGLGLPGTKTGTKRGFSDTVNACDQNSGNNNNFLRSTATKSPTPKAQVVGWPPVRASRKNAMMKSNCKYVKVAVDGAPYLRKVDLEIYESYDHLLRALETMFGCFLIIRNNHSMNEKKFMEPAGGNGIEYIPTYEDKDGDWMLVGDVPWKMFVESCKRIRLMISSEDIDLGPRTTPSKCTGSSEKIN